MPIRMQKTSKRLIEAVRNNKDAKGDRVSESLIAGMGSDDSLSVSLIAINQRGELSTMVFKNPREVTEMCASLQAASDAVFADGDMKPELTLPN